MKLLLSTTNRRIAVIRSIVTRVEAKEECPLVDLSMIEAESQ